MAGISTWRANDVIEYEAMRDSATLLMALLLQENYETVPGDIAQLRNDVLAVDAYDRAAVAELAAGIRSRIVELSRVTS